MHAAVSALAYLGLFGRDLEEWATFSREVLGAHTEHDPEAVKLRLDDRSHRITVRNGEPGLDHLGFECANEAALEAVVARLRDAGVEVREDAELAKQRSVARLFSCLDPAANRVELVIQQLSEKRPMISPKGHRFLAGHLGVGHVFMVVPDAAAATRFYRDLLGFRLSDTILLGDQPATFLHCNPRHHTVAFAELPGYPTGLQHLMVEVDDLDDVGRVVDLVDAGLVQPATTLGKHTNDEMVSIYLVTPSGFDIEFGTGGLLIDDETWTAQTYDSESYWGHRYLTD